MKAYSVRMQGQSKLRPDRKKDGSAGHLAGLTLLLIISNLLGKFVNQLISILSSNRFGMGVLTDAYSQGFMIPDFIYELLIGGSIQAAIIPTLSSARARGKEREGWRSISIFICVVSVIMLFILILAEFFAPTIMRAVTNEKTHELAVQVSRILFPQTFFMMLAALAIGIVNAYNEFAKSAFGPTLYSSFVVIALIVWGAPSEQAVVRVAYAVTCSAFLYFSWQTYMARKHLYLFQPSLNYQDPGFRRLVRLALPTLLASAIPQLNYMILSAIAKNFAAGTVTSLTHANKLYNLPSGIFAVSIANVMLPNLTMLEARKEYKAARRLLTKSLRMALYLISPFAILFYIFRFDVVQAVFQWRVGAYSDAAVWRTAAILLPYCLTIITTSILTIYNNAFFAIKFTRMPLLTGLISLILSTFFGYLLSTFTALGEIGLSMGFALGSLANAILLIYVYKRMRPQIAPRKLPLFFLKLSLCLSAVFLFFLALKAIAGPMVAASKGGQLLGLSLKFILGFSVFFVMSLLLRMPEPYALLIKIIQKLGFRAKT